MSQAGVEITIAKGVVVITCPCTLRLAIRTQIGTRRGGLRGGEVPAEDAELESVLRLQCVEVSEGERCADRRKH